MTLPEAERAAQHRATLAARAEWLQSLYRQTNPAALAEHQQDWAPVTAALDDADTSEELVAWAVSR